MYVTQPSEIIKIAQNYSNFCHFLRVYDSKAVLRSNQGVRRGGLELIYISHRSPTEQHCPSHCPQKSSKQTAAVRIFTIFLGYITYKWLPNLTNELKGFGRLEYIIVSCNNYKWCSRTLPLGLRN